MDLHIIRKEIIDILVIKRKSINLSFIEDTHTYYMSDLNGNIKDNYPSVSKVLKNFYIPFPEQEISLRKAKGDLIEQQRLLEEWRMAGEYSTNMGSRVHYLLEQHLVSLYGSYKDVRKPIFECDDNQIYSSNNMINAGYDFISLMHDRNIVLLDTEMVLGSPELGYTGQPDKVWLYNNNGNLGLICTDWKTNQPKNFEVHWYTKQMLAPFEKYHDTSLSHYYLQLPLYVRLLLNMLKGTKYENIKFLGAVIVLLKDDGTFQEYKIPKDIINKVFDLNFPYILSK